MRRRLPFFFFTRIYPTARPRAVISLHILAYGGDKDEASMMVHIHGDIARRTDEACVEQHDDKCNAMETTKIRFTK